MPYLIGNCKKCGIPIHVSWEKDGPKPDYDHCDKHKVKK